MNEDDTLNEDCIEALKSLKKWFHEESKVHVEIDNIILLRYSMLSDEEKIGLPFSDYYMTYRLILQTKYEEMLEKATNQRELIDELATHNEECVNEPQISSFDINQSTLCIICKKQNKSFDDTSFCVSCINELKNEAQSMYDDILKNECQNPELQNKSLPKVSDYIDQKYRSEKNKNKFLYLSKLAKQIHARIRIVFE